MDFSFVRRRERDIFNDLEKVDPASLSLFSEYNVPITLVPEGIRNEFSSEKVNVKEYLVPVSDKYREGVYSYTTSAVQFLIEHPTLLKNIRFCSFNIQDAGNGDDLRDKKYGNFFICDGIAKVYEDSILTFDISGNMEFSSSNDFYGNLGPVFGYFTTPFSEILGLPFIDHVLKHSKDKGEKRSIEGLEAITESLSHVLGEEIGSKLMIPGHRRVLRNRLKEMIGLQYKLVNSGIKMIREKGMEHAIQSYLDDPEKYCLALENSYQ